jgi:flagellum-specific ATP synthase
VIVAATSDRSPMERIKGAQAATAVAEHYAKKGKSVLLIIDSLTRYAMALRETGLAAGEPPATKGYPPSVFAALPKLLERVAPYANGGSITGFYTVLVEGDDLSDPVADSARSLLDGHIVLSRDLAARGHFPAIDLLASASRVALQVTPPECHERVTEARRILSVHREIEELKSLGAYTPGTHPEQERMLERGARLLAWCKQKRNERSSLNETMRSLAAVIAK